LCVSPCPSFRSLLSVKRRSAYKQHYACRYLTACGPAVKTYLRPCSRKAIHHFLWASLGKGAPGLLS
jgi:hypothetical protein